MKFHSTNKKAKGYNFQEVLLAGLAPDGGLFMPDRIPKLSDKFIANLEKFSFREIAEIVSPKFIDNLPPRALSRIIREVFNFPVPLRQIADNLFVLELFHGPTAAFKDFGARFMARIFAYFLKRQNKKITIITATSGDTGSAVASGFFGLPNIAVFILYPKGKVSPLQERQLTTFGGNITALEVEGTFDDCQALAKAALRDLSQPPLNLPLSASTRQGEKKSGAGGEIWVSSANSINFGRLLPQSFYYFWGVRELRAKFGIAEPPVYVVPSGNFGNLVGGLLAAKMGLPVSGFVAATNTNQVVPKYLATGKFIQKKSKSTISNAMDVGNPSNFARMLEIFKGDHQLMRKTISGISIDDRETRRTIKETYHQTGYILDPHTAVGVAAAKRHGLEKPTIVLATAHPAKFREIVEPVISQKVRLPSQLAGMLQKKKKSIIIKNDLKELTKFLRHASIRRD
ncbi:MAG: threonine synthase [bacterium]|nr:threonine synthase [bacterium]